MTKLANLAAPVATLIAATPALAHSGHAEAPGAFGHDLAHLALIGAGVLAATLIVTLGRNVVARRREG